MSSTALRLRKIQLSCESFERNRNLLVAALDQREPRQCLDAFAELCELYLEQTGGTLRTATYRAELQALRQLVAERPRLTLMTPTQKEPPTMSFNVETAMPCLACGAPGRVTLACHGTFQCTCTHCYDPAPDSSFIASANGMGDTAEKAVADWADTLQEALGIEYWHDDARIAFELRRQAGWVQTVTAQGTWYGPELLAAE